MNPTVEQQNISSLVKLGNNVKVIAGAGTGKSSTLRYISKQVPARNVLVLTFNKANAEETLHHPDRPTNLFACTSHSLAYRAVIDGHFKPKLSNYLDYNDIPKEQIDQCIWMLGLPDASEEKKALILFRREIINSIKLFCQSDKLAVANVTESYLKWRLITAPESKLIVPIEVVNRLSEIANTYWQNLVESPRTKITPDVYLKLFHLWDCKIEQVWDVKLKRYVTIQVLALDEGQDTNGVMEAIFRNQTHLQRILVGDPNQQLYRWRGAGDAMNNFKEFEVGYLSESFRFNGEIARMANIVLERNNSPLRLIGSGKQVDVVTKAILCRTNACVLDTFFNLVTKGLTEKVNISTDFKTSFSKMYHMEACYFNNEPKYPVSELAAITDSITLHEALSYSDELSNLWELRNKLTKSAGSLYKAQEHLKQHIVSGSEKATLTISTIHGSKGLEWDNVTIANDFVSIPKGVEVEDAVANMWEDTDLRCMLYVAVTRAKVSIQLPYYLLDDFNIKEVFDKTVTKYY